jgi:putative phosphoesterase
MIAGFLSDAHGNPAGLERCLLVLAKHGAERLYFLGDAVGYLPECNEVLDLLREAGVIPVAGNHDAMLLGRLPLPDSRDLVYRLGEARARVHSHHAEWLAEWPLRLECRVGSASFLLVHGSPRDPLEGYVYPDAELSQLASEPFDNLVMGHTHRPFLARAGTVNIVNVGSSGLPRDMGRLSSCALYDSDQGTWTILRTEFDAEGLARRLEGRIHASVADCLRRVSPQQIIGSVVAP